ncbi:MAG: DMT family transporter [Candidatus Atribacteria bacterium]|nr:DMT family transporter [Candidatus Atribacteria bacterium]
MKNLSQITKIYLKLTLVSIFFASNFIVARLMSTRISPITSSAMRFVIASCVLVIIVFQKYRTLPKINPYQLKIIFLLGIIGIAGDTFCFFSGLKYTTASKASIIVALNPVFLALFSRIFFKEKLQILKLTGIFISFIGAVIVISNGAVLSMAMGNIGLGELYILGSVICWVIFSLMGKSINRTMDSIIILCYASIVGSIILAGIAFGSGALIDLKNLNIPTLLGSLSIGILGTAISYQFYYEAIYFLGASRSGIFLNLIPVFATIGGILVLGEHLRSAFIIGAMMVLSGVLITNFHNNHNN